MMKALAAIAGKGFVRPVARQHDFDPLARQLGDPPGRQRRSIGEGFVKQPGQLVDRANLVGRDPP